MGLDYSYIFWYKIDQLELALTELANWVGYDNADGFVIVHLPNGKEMKLPFRDLGNIKNKHVTLKPFIFGKSSWGDQLLVDVSLPFKTDEFIVNYFTESIPKHLVDVFPIKAISPIGSITTSVTIGETYAAMNFMPVTSRMCILFQESTSIRECFLLFGHQTQAVRGIFDIEEDFYYEEIFDSDVHIMPSLELLDEAEAKFTYLIDREGYVFENCP